MDGQLVKLIIGLLGPVMLLSISCGGDVSSQSSDPVSVARIRMGEKLDSQCVFGDDLSRYPVTYSGVSEECLQALSIGPLSLAELEEMQQDEPLFWENSFPYRQALMGEKSDGECDFSHPAVQAYLDFSEALSTDESKCVMIVKLGPATEKQIEAVQRHGSVSSESAAPAPLRLNPVNDE